MPDFAFQENSEKCNIPETEKILDEPIIDNCEVPDVPDPIRDAVLGDFSAPDLSPNCSPIVIQGTVVPDGENKVVVTGGIEEDPDCPGECKYDFSLAVHVPLPPDGTARCLNTLLPGSTYFGVVDGANNPAGPANLILPGNAGPVIAPSLTPNGSPNGFQVLNIENKSETFAISEQVVIIHVDEKCNLWFDTSKTWICELINGYPVLRNSLHHVKLKGDVGGGGLVQVEFLDDPYKTGVVLAINASQLSAKQDDEVYMWYTETCERVFFVEKGRCDEHTLMPCCTYEGVVDGIVSPVAGPDLRVPPGEMGNIKVPLFDANGDPVVGGQTISIKNHSETTASSEDRVTVHVGGDCELWFHVAVERVCEWLRPTEESPGVPIIKNATYRVKATGDIEPGAEGEVEFEDVSLDSEKVQAKNYSGRHKIKKNERVLMHVTDDCEYYLHSSDEESVVLTRCSDKKIVISVDVDIPTGGTPLSENIGAVIAIKGTALLEGACWTITGKSQCYPEICPEVYTVVDGCGECTGCWRLVYCGTPYDQKIVEVSSFSESELSLKINDVVRLGDGKCYTIKNSDTCYGSESVTVVAKVGKSCDACSDCVYLQICGDDGYTMLIYADDHGLEKDNVVKVGGDCWEVIELGTSEDLGGSPVHHPPFSEIFKDCKECGCYLLTPCGTGSSVQVHSAFDTDGGVVDLHEVATEGGVVRLDSGICYSVSVTETCDSTVSVTVQEHYDSCPQCLCYELEICPGQTGSDIVTYSDLSAYANNDIVRVEDETRSLCYKIIGITAWTQGAIEAIVTQVYPQGDCTSCTSPRYSMTPCGGCDDCGYSGGTAVKVAGGGVAKITDEDLSLFVDKYVKYDGRCYLVGRSSDAKTLDAGFDHTGPYESCAACQRTCIWVVTDVYHDVTGEKIGQKRVRIVTDMICEEDDLTVVELSDCPKEPV